MLAPLATDAASLPMDLVGWAVTVVGLALTIAWVAYLYR